MKNRLLGILVLTLAIFAEPASVVSSQINPQTMTPEQALQAWADMKFDKALNNEVRFAAMQTSAAELLRLSKKVHAELQANGAQTISLAMFKDLDEIEKTVNALRKSGK